MPKTPENAATGMAAAVSSAVLKMSGDLNGGAARFAVILAHYANLSGDLNGGAAHFAARLQLVIKNRAKVRRTRIFAGFSATLSKTKKQRLPPR